MIQYLSVLHQHGIYHSDIKPSNIIITKPAPVNPSQSIINSGFLAQSGIPSMVGMGMGKSGMTPIGGQ